MLLKYINSNRLSVIVLFILLPVLFWIPSWTGGASESLTYTGGMPLGGWIIALNENYRALASVVALLLIILNGYLLIQLNTAHIFIPYRTQLPLFFYTILVVCFNQLHYLTSALVASTLIIVLFYRIFGAYKNESISINFFDAGLLISVASLIYFPAIFFFPCLLVALVLIRPFIWREWAFAFTGLIIPYVFVFSACYLNDNFSVADLFDRIGNAFIRSGTEYRLSQIVNWSYVFVFMTVASYYIARAIDSMKIHARKFFLVFLAFFVFSILLFFVVPGSGPGIAYFAAVPLSYLFTHYFTKCKRSWVNDVLFALFVGLFIWQRIA